MKNVKVRYNYLPKDSKPSEGILFEGIEDIKAIKTELRRSEESVQKKIAKSGEPAYRLDHILNGFQPIEKSISVLACSKASLDDDRNPIAFLRECSNLFLTTLITDLSKDRKVFMNKNGGLTPVEDTLTIVEESDFDGFNKKEIYYIREGSKVINLENGVELERNAVKFMEDRFSYTKKSYSVPYSYISEMSLLSQYQLSYILKKFKDIGGEYVYVYTSGQNYEQMYEYSKEAIKVGLTNFIFEFNCGQDDNIRKFISWITGLDKTNIEIL